MSTHHLIQKISGRPLTLSLVILAVGHDVSAAPRRIALFSLGNFAGYGECRGMLLDPSLGFEEVMGAAAGSRDPVIGKYLQRIRNKLNA